MEIIKGLELQFEYKIMTYYGLMEEMVTQDILKKKNTSSEDVLNELGKDGWELFTILQGKENCLFIFKRSKWVEKKAQEKQEKQDDNSNKVERKFKFGDWIVNQHGTVRHIEEVGNVGYQTDEGWLTHDCYEKDFRLWSITDAKDGDILYSLDSRQPFIYKNRKPFNQAEAYCGINIYGKFFVWNTKDCVITLDKYVPATKEQRNTLMKAMADAGYTFDFEKKELKKIEASLPSFDEQQGTPIIDIPFGAKESELQEASYHIPEGFHAEIQGDKVVIKKGKNPSWSEGDSFMTRTLIDVVNSRASIRQELRNEYVDWLESLKQRVKGE